MHHEDVNARSRTDRRPYRGCRPTRRLPVALVLAATLLVGRGAMPAVDVDALSRPLADSGPTPVEVAVYLVDLFEIDSARQTFNADVVIVARWNDPRLAGRWPHSRSVETGSIWRPRLQVVNQRKVERSMDREVEVLPDGTVLYRQRLSGDFSARLDLREFPLDRQRFAVQVVATGYTPEEVDLKPVGAASGRATEFSVSDWHIGDVELTDADLELPGGSRILPGVALGFEGSRALRYYVVQLMLPLVAIALMAWAVFWIDPSVVGTRMSVVVTTMLTLIAYRFMINSLVPKLAYLTRLDYFLLGATVLIVVALLAVSAGSYLVAHDRVLAVRRMDRWSRGIYPAMLLLLVVGVWLV
jgi:hypothetical protein